MAHVSDQPTAGLASVALPRVVEPARRIATLGHDPVTRLVDLSRATRESVMDLEPWSYVVMAHELHAERKIRPDGGLDMNTIDDPRRYVYVEAQLELHSAAAVAHARGADGVWRASHFRIPELRIDRSGWVRVAVPTGDAAPTAIGWSCEPTARSPGGDGVPTCRISATRAFRLSAAYEVGPNLIRPASLTLAPGELRVIDTII